MGECQSKHKKKKKKGISLFEVEEGKNKKKGISGVSYMGGMVVRVCNVLFVSASVYFESNSCVLCQVSFRDWGSGGIHIYRLCLFLFSLDFFLLRISARNGSQRPAESQSSHWIRGYFDRFGAYTSVTGVHVVLTG